MNPRLVNLIVFDSKQNFKKSVRFLGEEGASFKRIICVENATQFHTQFNLLNETDYVLLVVHVFSKDQISGIRSFLASGIKRHYPNLTFMYITEGNVQQIKHEIIDASLPENVSIHKYHDVQTNIEMGSIHVYTKQDILQNSALDRSLNTKSDKKFPKIKYGVITALFKDEFEQLKNVFDFPEEKEIRLSTKTYYRGYLKTNANIEIVAAVPNASGMVDSAIIATQMIEYFEPDYLLMSGVCGSSSEYNFGDIIVAKQIFTFQKGKLSDLHERTPDNKIVKLELFDGQGRTIDYDRLFDADGNQVSVSIEKFEREHDAVIGLDTGFEDRLMTKKEIIEDKINAQVRKESFFEAQVDIKIEIQPIACSTMVINKEGFFEDTIRVINRKTAAVEMESYGVARACHFANGGRTIPIIFKSVMDHTSNKTDSVAGINNKKFAAYTSAMFMKLLFQENVI